MMVLASAAVSIVALVGIIFIKFNEEKTKRITHFLISFAAGTLLGAGFLSILPEAIEHATEHGAELKPIFFAVIIGFLVFFIFEKTLVWYHCHDNNGYCELHRSQSAPLILFGDAIHNFIDGIVIGLAFLVDSSLGIVTTIAVAVHEIPQEIGDFSILLHSNYSKGRALLFNFLVATTTIFGAVFAYFVAGLIALDTLIPLALGFVAGGFIYIAGVDLIPEIHKDSRLGHSIAAIALFLFGIFIIYLTGVLLPHG